MAKKKKKKLNLKFLIALVVLMVLLSGGGVGFYFYREAQKDPTKFVQAGQRAMQEKNYPEALNQFGQALARRNADPSLWIMVGDALDAQASVDPENYVKARQAWEHALEIDANNVDALRRLLTRVQQEVELTPHPSPAAFIYIRDKARLLAAADPNDSNAKAAGPIAGVQAAISGSQPDQHKLDEDIASLQDLQKQDPTNADIPFYIARGKMIHASEAQRTGDKATLKQLTDAIEQIFNNALASQPDNAKMFFRGAQVENYIAILLQPSKESEDAMKLAETRAAKAMSLADAKSPLYLDVAGYYAKLLARRGEMKQAEAIYRKLIADRPNEIVVRLALSDLLTVNNRADEAIKLLEDAPKQAEPLGGPRGALYKTQQTNILLNLSNLQLDAYLSESNEQKRKALLAQIQDTIAKVGTSMGSEVPAVLRVRGKMQLYKGDVVPAIQTLTKALNLMDENDTGRYETIYLLARGYVLTQQPGEARKRLQQIVDKLPDYFEARLELAQLLVAQNDVTDARPHIEKLAQMRPEDPSVIVLVLRTLDPQKDKQRIDSEFARLPETRRQDRLAKAQLAFYLQKNDESVRLLQLVLKDNPGDADASVTLARVLASTNQKDQAIAVVDQAIQKNPNNPALKALRDTFAAATPDEARAKRRKLIDQISDPFERELTLYDFYLQDQDYAQAIPHLQAAQKLKPQDPRVVEQLFQYELTQKNWDQATKFADILAKADADHIGGRSYKFRLAASRGDMASAVDIARDATQQLPELAQSWLIWAEALQMQNKYDEAISSFQRTIDKQGQNVEAYRGLVDCYYALARPGEAKKAIDQARVILPNNDVIRDMALSYESKYGDPEKPLPEREQILARNPAVQASYRSLGDAYIAAAQAKQTAGDEAGHTLYLQKARDTFAKAVERWPDEISFTDAAADLSLQLKNVDAGEQMWKALAARPVWKDKPDPTGGLADYYRRANRLPEAEKTLRDFIAAHDSAGMRLQLVDLLVLEKRDNDAIDVVSVKSDDPRIEQRRIELLIGAKRNDEAKAAIDAAMKSAQNASSPELHLLMAYVDINSGRSVEAAKELDTVIAAQPRNPNALYYRALLRLQNPKNDLDQAIAELSLVRDLMPSKMEARYALADAFNRKGDDDSAIRELDAMIRFNPAEKMARLKLAELYATQRPPRWTEVERVLREARSIPQLEKDVDLRHAEAVMWMQRKDGDKALASIREALSLAPGNVNVLRTYFDILLQQHDYRRVLNDSDQLLTQRKDLWWVYQARAVAWHGLDERDRSLAEFQQALNVTAAAKDDKSARTVIRTMAHELGPEKAIEFVQPRAENDVRWRLVLGYLYMLRQDWSNAEKTTDAVLADFDHLSDAEQDQALGYASVIYLSMQPPDRERAKDVYLRTLAKHPDDYVTENNLACLLLSMEGSKPADVLNYSKQAYEGMQKKGIMEPLVIDTYGWANVLNGQVQVGIELLRQALDRQVFEDVLYHLGEAHLKLKPPKPREAEKYLLRAQELADKEEGTGQRTDPPLKPKIDSALSEAQRLIRQGPSELPSATQASSGD